MSTPHDLIHEQGLQPLPAMVPSVLDKETRSVKAMRNRVNLIANHMFKQLNEHNEAIQNTNQAFYELLDHLDTVCEAFRDTFAHKNIPAHQMYSEVDADRSVGILNILWHSVSFTTRGNNKPLALYRYGLEPMFTGRILALRGDFHEISYDVDVNDVNSLLHYELASLYIPADPTRPAVMRIKHLGDKEQFLHQSDAPQLFLLKTIEMVCGGGFFHEQEDVNAL